MKLTNERFGFFVLAAIVGLIALAAALRADEVLVVPANADSQFTPAAWAALIPFLVPMLVALLKLFLPNIPKVILPILCPILGALLDILGHYAGLATAGTVQAAVLGGAGVFVREVYDQVGKMRAPAVGPVMLALCLLPLAACLSGCTTAIQHGNIISVKQRVFGLCVGTDAVNNTPKVQFGLTTTVVQFIPTSTNSTIAAPRFFDTFEIDSTGNPFKTGVRENTGAGDVAIGTNATGTAIIPKIPAPTMSIVPVITR
jgi:hypothetical protein